MADREKVRRWQRRLNPLQRRLADGCNLDRPIDRLVEKAGLPIVAMRSFYFKKFPKFLGYFYQGMAERR